MRNSNLSREVKNRLFRVGSEALWVFIGQFGVAIGGLFGIKTLTYILNPHEFGRLSLANTIILLIGSNLFGPLSQGLMRFWSISKERGELKTFINISNNYIKRLVLFVLLISFVMWIMLVLIHLLDWAIILGISLVVGSLTGWLSVRLSVLAAARKRKVVALVNSLNAFTKPLMGALLAFYIISNAGLVLIGFFLSICVSLVIAERVYGRIVGRASRFYQKKNNLITDKINKLSREILAFSWPFFIWGIFSWVHQSCDRWSLAAYYNTEIVGAFAVITLLAAYPLIFGSNFLSTLFMPIVYERAGDLNSTSSVESATRIIFLMIGLYIFGALVLISFFKIFHFQIVLLISNINYVNISYLLPGLTTSWALFYLGQALSGFGLMANKPRLYILPVCFSGITAAATTFYLSAKSGPLGVVWGLGIAGFIYALWFLIIAIRLSNTHP